MKTLTRACLITLLSGVNLGLLAAPLGTSFTYQGRLADGSLPAQGVYDFRFALYDSSGGPAQIGTTLTNAVTPVSDGVFTVALDFGAVFDGNERWLEIGVRTNGGGAFTTLTPRQSLTAAPYAAYAPSAGAAVTATTASSANSVAAANVSGTLALAQLPAPVITNNATGVTLGGTFSGSGVGLTSVNADLVDGQHGAFYQNATNLTSGTLADARLSSGVALRGATNTFTGTNAFTKPVGIDCLIPGRLLQVGNPNTFGSQGMIRIASRSTNSADSGVWDIGVPQTGANLTGAGYSFVIDDTQLGTDPEFMVKYGTGRVGIGRTNPATALDVNGTVTASGFAGNASGLTNVPAAGLAGTLGLAQLPAPVVTNNAAGVNLSGSFSGNGADLTNLNASQLSGTVSLAQLPTSLVTNNATGVSLTGSFSGNGAGLTNLTGAIADARLSTNVALRNATNIFTATNYFTKAVGIGTTNPPGQLLQVGDPTLLAGSVGMIRLASRYSSNYRIWDMGVAQNILQPTPYDYSFIIDDTLLGTGPEFMIHWGNGYVGIGKTNPATALDVNGTVTATAFAGTFSGSGASLTGLNASQLTTGAVADGRLSTNVSLLGSSVESSEITDGTIAATDVNVSSFNTTFWRTAGNAGTTAGTHFVGTTDSQALELRVNNLRALRLEPGAFGGTPNVIGGYSGNSVGSTFYEGSTIGGGGGSDAGYTQTISAPFATIAGGAGNIISNSANFSTICGGLQNAMGGSALEATIGGGYQNSIGYNCNHGVIGGGYLNRIGDYSYDTTIGGGYLNDLGTNTDKSTISGGQNNNIAHNSGSATIAGGSQNDIGESSAYSTISGGQDNNIANSSGNCAIAGGYSNDVGVNSSYTAIGGGYNNDISTDTPYATIPGGKEARVRSFGQMAYASGQIASLGDAQSSVYVVRGTTIGLVTNALFLDGISRRMLVPTNTVWTFEITVAARSSAGQVAAYSIRGIISNGSGTTTLPAAATVTAVYEADAAWNIVVSADDTNDALVVSAIGNTGDTIRWVATVRTTEVSH
jgi:hypothetical protein